MHRYGRRKHYCNTLLKFHAQFRKSTRKNPTQAACKIGRGAARRGQFYATRVSRFSAWICETARDSSLGLAFEGRKKLVFSVFCIFCQISPSVQEPRFSVWGTLLGPQGRFYGLGARKTQKTKQLQKPSQVQVSVAIIVPSTV